MTQSLYESQGGEDYLYPAILVLHNITVTLQVSGKQDMCPPSLWRRSGRVSSSPMEKEKRDDSRGLLDDCIKILITTTGKEGM